MYLVILNGRSIAERVLLEAFRRTRSTIIGMEGKVEHAVTAALRICVGSVFNRHLDARTGNVVYELYNPSIADYIFGTVKDWCVYWRYFAALRTPVALRVLMQMLRAEIISTESFRLIVKNLAESERSTGTVEHDEYAIQLCEMLTNDASLRVAYEKMIGQVVNHIAYDECCGYESLVLSLVTNCVRIGLLEEPGLRACELVDWLSEWPLNGDELVMLSELVKEFSGNDHQTLLEKAHQCVKDFWSENVDDYIRDSDLLTELYEADQYDEALRELSDSVSQALRDVGFRLSRDEIAEICLNANMDNIVDRNINREARYNYSPDYRRPLERDVEEQMIEDLFERDGR